MSKKISEKKMIVENLKEIFSSYETVIVSKNLGLTVAETNKIRAKMREISGYYLVVKNTLIKRASKDTKCEALNSIFGGSIAISYSNEGVALCKESVEYAKVNQKMVLLGAVINGTFFDNEGIKKIALLPSQHEIRGKLIGILQASGSKIASILQAPGSQIARVINAHANNNK